MINLRLMIQKYPECMKSKEKLSALLNDLYPEQQRMVYALTLCYDCGIIYELRRCKRLDTFDINKYAQHLILRYGIQEQLALEAVNLWCNALDISQDDYSAHANTPPNTLPAELKVGAIIEARVAAVLDTILMMDIGVPGEYAVLPKAYCRQKDFSVGDRITTTVKSYNQEGPYPHWNLSAILQSKFHAGDRVVGTVAHIYDRVAEITLDDTESGFLHIADLSWEPVKSSAASMGDYVRPGEKIEVYVKELRADGRITLSRQFPETDPLHKLVQAYLNSYEDIILHGIIEAVYPHGFFVYLGEGLVGLVHESQYESGRQYQEGQHVTVSVNSIDEEKRRISLKLIY